MWPFTSSYNLTEFEAQIVSDILQEKIRMISAETECPVDKAVRIASIRRILSKLPEASLPNNVVQFPFNDDPPKAA